MQITILDWIKTIGSLLLSWPVIVFILVMLFLKPLKSIIGNFTGSKLRKAKVGPIEVELELEKLATQGEKAVSNVIRLTELMAESRLLELEITESMFGSIFTPDQRKRMQSQIEELRKLTEKDKK